MKSGTLRNKTIWIGGAVIALCICFLLCRYTFFELHGSKQYPVFLLIISLIAILIAAFINGKKIMIGTVIGYIGGFSLGILFGVDGVDQGGARTNNWWWIWIVSFVVFILMGVLWEIVSRYMKKKKM